MDRAEQRRQSMARLRSYRRAANLCAQCGAASNGYRCDECRADHKLSNPPEDVAVQRERMRRIRAATSRAERTWR